MSTSSVGYCRRAVSTVLTVHWLCPFGSTHTFAQVITDDVVETVNDTSGAVVPRATVKIENVGTHETRTTISNGTGNYVFNLLRPGQYDRSTRFESFENPREIALSAGARARADGSLEVGQAYRRALDWFTAGVAYVPPGSKLKEA